MHYANLEREKARAAGATTTQSEAVYASARAAEMSGQSVPAVDANLERQKALAAGASVGDAERIFSAARAVQAQQSRSSGRGGVGLDWVDHAFWRWFVALMFTWMRDDENPAARGAFLVMALVVAVAVSIPLGFALSLFGSVLLRAIWGIRLGGDVAITAGFFITFCALIFVFFGQRDGTGRSPAVRRWVLAAVLGFIGSMLGLQAYVESRPRQQQASVSQMQTQLPVVAASPPLVNLDPAPAASVASSVEAADSVAEPEALLAEESPAIAAPAPEFSSSPDPFVLPAPPQPGRYFVDLAAGVPSELAPPLDASLAAASGGGYSVKALVVRDLAGLTSEAYGEKVRRAWSSPGAELDLLVLVAAGEGRVQLSRADPNGRLSTDMGVSLLQEVFVPTAGKENIGAGLVALSKSLSAALNGTH